MRLRKYAFIGILLLFLWVRASGVAAWNQLPLLTQSPDILSSGSLQFGIGVQYLHHKNFGFSQFSKDFSRNVLSCPLLELSIGLGKRVELQTTYEVLFVEEEEFQIREPWRSGDLAFFSKVEFWGEQRFVPQTGIRIGVKAPNASNPYRVGTDETDFVFSGLFKKTFSQVTTTVNLGILVLGNPFRNAAQDDLLSYALACSFPWKDRFTYTAEIAGQAFGTEHNELASALLHMDIGDGRLTWKISGRVGLVENSADWGLTGGVSINSDVLRRWATGQ